MVVLRLPVAAPQRPSPPQRGDRVLADVLHARWATADAPPSLGASVAHAERARDVDDLEALDYALREISVAAMAALSRLRTLHPELLTRCPPPQHRS